MLKQLGPSIEEQASKPLTVYLNDFDSVIPDLFKEKTGYDVEVSGGQWCRNHVENRSRKSKSPVGRGMVDSMYDIYNLDLDGQL